MARISTRQVQRILRKLTEGGYIQQLTSGHGRGNRAYYRVLLKGDICDTKDDTIASPFDATEKATSGALKGDIWREKVTSGALKGDTVMSPEPYRTVLRTVGEPEGDARAREASGLPVAVPPPIPSYRQNGNGRYRRREQLRAQGNLAEAVKIGMDAQHLREWTDWILDQADWLQLVDNAPDDARLGKAQQCAIQLWRLGFDSMDRLQDIRAWLEGSSLSPPFYPANLEQAAGSIVKGTAPPGKRKQDRVPVSIQNLYEMALEEMDFGQYSAL